MSQSIVLGYLSDYFILDDPTPEDTRDAYLYAAGEWWDPTSTNLLVVECRVPTSTYIAVPCPNQAQ